MSTTRLATRLAGDDLTEYRRQLEYEYTRMMAEMYRRWSVRGYSAQELRIEMARWVMNRCLDRSLEEHHRRIAPQRALNRAARACELLAAAQAQKPPIPHGGPKHASKQEPM